MVIYFIFVFEIILLLFDSIFKKNYFKFFEKSLKYISLKG